jgi:endoglucanase
VRVHVSRAARPDPRHPEPDPAGLRDRLFVGTHGWSTFGISDGGSETEVFNNPVNATKFMYTFHFYAASHKAGYLTALSRIADRVPGFATDDERSGAVFKTGTCAGGNFAGTSVLKPAGVWVRDRTRTPDDFPTS